MRQVWLDFFLVPNDYSEVFQKFDDLIYTIIGKIIL